jgi:hypothetical protein
MSALVIALAMVAMFATAATVALVLSRASRERVIRREIAAEIRAHAAQVSRFPAAAQFASGLSTAARIAEGLQVSSGFVTSDASGNVRKAGDWRRSS